jgi:hypothetical protein
MNQDSARVDPAQLIFRLTSEFGYPLQGARLVADKLSTSAPEIRNAFLAWWTGGDLPSVEIGGFTLRWLMEERGMKPIAALLTLDWVMREPEVAAKSLRKGYDTITLDSERNP